MDNQKVDISVELSGSVEDVIYKNADNGYTVINLGCDDAAAGSQARSTADSSRRQCVSALCRRRKPR